MLNPSICLMLNTKLIYYRLALFDCLFCLFVDRVFLAWHVWFKTDSWPSHNTTIQRRESNVIFVVCSALCSLVVNWWNQSLWIMIIIGWYCMLFLICDTRFLRCVFNPCTLWTIFMLENSLCFTFLAAPNRHLWELHKSKVY